MRMISIVVAAFIAATPALASREIGTNEVMLTKVKMPRIKQEVPKKASCNFMTVSIDPISQTKTYKITFGCLSESQ